MSTYFIYDKEKETRPLLNVVNTPLKFFFYEFTSLHIVATFTIMFHLLVFCTLHIDSPISKSTQMTVFLKQ